jgi:prefoldin subunit 5
MCKKAEEKLEGLIQTHNNLAQNIQAAQEHLQLVQRQIIAAQAVVATLKAATGQEPLKGSLPDGFDDVFAPDKGDGQTKGE